ncbi:MAG: cation diffusion facilitator family transporter [Bacillota bacterium]
MIRVLIRRFVKNHRNVADKDVRESYGVLAGTIGIICNMLLFALKFAVGLLASSIAVTSDAFNNLSDAASSIVGVVGARMSNRPPDAEHPYGHGRSEYIAALVVSFIIFAVGLELLRASFSRLGGGEQAQLSPINFVLLVLSVLVKLWMFSYNRYIARVINSGINRATAQDSLNDVVATSAVIAGTLLGRLTHFPVDGVLGLAISGLIMYTGFKTAKDSVDSLLGAPPDHETSEKIYSIVLSCKSIEGAHDLRIHDYGPGRRLASIHAEVSDEANIVDIHWEIDRIEKRIEEELGISMVIHVDPETSPERA